MLASQASLPLASLQLGRESPLSGLPSLPIVRRTRLRGFPRRPSLPWQAPAKVQDHCVAPDEIGTSQRSRSAPQL